MPTSSEILPPITTRASTSRPSGSVPKGWAAEVKGLARRAIRSILSAPPGNIRSENSTAKQMTLVRNAPRMNSTLMNRDERDRVAAMRLLRANAGIDQAIGYVDQKIDADDHQR